MLKINEMYNVGTIKYLVNYYIGEKHKDNSDFYNVALFKNKRKKNAFINQLNKQYGKSN